MSTTDKDWVGDPRNASPDGEFVRDTTYIDDRITADAPAGQPTAQEDGTFHWPVEAGRYRLIAARACPWAHRAVIVRRLMGLEDVISLGLAGPTHDVRSWTFDLDPGGVDPVLDIPRLQEAYFNRFPDYPRGITVPAMVEESSKKVVTNDFPSLVRDMIIEWTDHHRPGAPNLYPAEHAEEMEEINKYLFTEINNGVYRCGFAGTQEAYEAAYERLWNALDWAEERLSARRYLVGDHVTETDIRLFTTLVRFDAVYHGHFKASRNKITEMPNLWGYLRELFQLPGFGDTTDFTEIKQHYYIVHKEVNPTQIVPVGPDLSGLATPHGREAFGGQPFADGTTLPGPLPEGEGLKNPEPFQK
ncbi:glutathione S-transferase family protein [Corynebacterium halotolerans]|uniref:Glutathione S-transferase n=1 Tax=Corynebacterium halotolerans YIM 70093 = DSM 44683 TaxID=1121362 RepID=M1NS27_9CORY|nr:glutathione S-transferase family protein [Corynebacterium halotolerans]AGF72292.1 glutathione S-transferase [Corynebacterium halotolerans YIM 70093 = DSM 44683]